MKVVILNFYDPVEKRLLQWFRDHNIEIWTLKTEDMNNLALRITDLNPDILFINIDRSRSLKSTISYLRNRFESLVMIGLTDHFSMYLKGRLCMFGLNLYIDINKLMDEGLSHFSLDKLLNNGYLNDLKKNDGSKI